MKVVQLIDLNGFFIEDDIETNANFNEVVKTYTSTIDESGEVKQVHNGYRVGVPMTKTFYKPRFKVDVWNDYLNLVYIYESKYKEWLESESEEDKPERVKIENFTFWVEGLTQEEIDELNKPPQKGQIELLQDELTNTQLALSDVYEQLLASQDETTSVQKALVDVYEQLLLFIEGGSQNA